MIFRSYMRVQATTALDIQRMAFWSLISQWRTPHYTREAYFDISSHQWEDIYSESSWKLPLHSPTRNFNLPTTLILIFKCVDRAINLVWSKIMAEFGVISIFSEGKHRIPRGILFFLPLIHPLFTPLTLSRLYKTKRHLCRPTCHPPTSYRNRYEIQRSFRKTMKKRNLTIGDAS